MTCKMFLFLVEDAPRVDFWLDIYMFTDTKTSGTLGRVCKQL